MSIHFLTSDGYICKIGDFSESSCKKLVTSIGISVSEKVWNNGKVRSKKYTNCKGITGLEINSIISKIENHFAQYELELESKPSTEDIKHELPKV